MTNVPFAVREFPIASIEIPANHRRIDDAVVANIAESIAAFGLRTPITVEILSENPLKVKIIDGVHRFKALVASGATEVPCFTMTAELEARAWTPGANILRADLSVQARAEATASWFAALSALKGAQVAQVSGGRGNRGGISEIARMAGVDRTEAARASAIA